MFFIKFGKFVSIISANIFSSPFIPLLSSPLGVPLYIFVTTHDGVPWDLGFCSFFCILFPFCFSSGMLALYFASSNQLSRPSGEFLFSYCTFQFQNICVLLFIFTLLMFLVKNCFLHHATVIFIFVTTELCICLYY